MKRLTCIIVLLSFQNSFSQTIDSLHRLIKTRSHEDTTYLLALGELAYQYHATYPDSSLRFARQVDSLSKKIDYNKGRGRALRIVGIYYLIRSDYDKSLYYFSNAVSFSKKANDQNNIARCYGNIGVATSEQGNYEKALEYYLRSLKIWKEIGDKQGVLMINNSIGLIYREQGNDTKALEYFKNSVKPAIEIGDKKLLAILYQNIAVIYNSEKKYHEALEHFQKALEILDIINDKRVLIFLYGNLAETYINVKETNKALPYLEKALNEANELKAAQPIAFVEEIYAKYYYANGDFKSAYQYALESQAHAKKIGNLEAWRNASKQKYLAAYALGKYKEALENYDLFVHLRDSLKNEQVNRKTVSLEYELKEEKVRRDQERKELELAAAQERQKLIATLVGVIIFMVAAASIYLLFRVWSSKAKKEMAKIRERISRDIHDDMGSNLSTINILSGVAIETLSESESVKAKDLLGKISVMSNLVMESVDEIVWSINPEQDSFEKIITRMRLLGGQLENQGVIFSFEIKGNPSKCTLDLEQRHDFYLIYKEAITNIAKYAKCRNVDVVLNIEPVQISLSIKDDGIGFEVDSQANGNGLKNMRSRARSLKGHLEVVSVVNQGTSLELIFPI